jgi:hypothetical protein
LFYKEKKMNILNVITQILAFADPTVTDNPQLRNIDWSRRIEGVQIKKPEFDTRILAPGEEYTAFDGFRSTSLSGSSVLSLTLVDAATSRYRMRVTAGPSGFRTERSVSGISSAVVTVNNSAVASFSFPGSVLGAVQVGDIMRISGALAFDAGPYSFNALNAGLWKVLAVSGTVIQAARLTGEPFSGVTENVSSVSAGNVRFYSAAGVQVKDALQISGTFSVVTQRIYEVADVTPDSIDFISAQPLPDESGLTYVVGTIVFAVSAKQYVYVEVDQDAVIRFNDDVSDNNKVSPIVTGNAIFPGFIHKHGDAYKLVIVNKSVNQLSMRLFMAE